MEEIFTCCSCKRPLSSFYLNTDDGPECVDCAYEDAKDLKYLRKKVILDSFINMLLPLILTCFALVLFWIFGATGLDTPQAIAFFLFLGSIVYAGFCGAHFVDRYKAYVGEPEVTRVSVSVTESWTGKYWATTRPADYYSWSQIAKVLYNIVMTILGLVLVYVFGWLSFIITCVKYSKKKVSAIQESCLEKIKDAASDFDFHIDEAIKNLDDNKFVVIPIHYVEDVNFLPIHYRTDGDITYIYGVIKLKNGLPAPLAILYYRDLKLAFPSNGSAYVVSGEDTNNEALAAALNSVPNQMGYINQYFKKPQQKLLGVPAFDELDYVEFDAKGNVTSYLGKDEKPAKSKTAKAGGVTADDDDDDDFLYKVVLVDVGSHKVKLVRAIAENLGLDLDDAKEIVDDAPNSIVKDGMEESDAKALAEKLKELGATVKVKISK